MRLTMYECALTAVRVNTNVSRMQYDYVRMWNDYGTTAERPRYCCATWPDKHGLEQAQP